MSAFMLMPGKNSLKRSTRGKLQFTITADMPGISTVRDCTVDLSTLTQDSNWGAEVASNVTDVYIKRISSKGIKDKLVFTFKNSMSTPFSFVIDNILPREDLTGQVLFTISLTDDLDSVQLLNGSVWIEEEIPCIEYFQVDPSIVRKNDAIAISCSCKNIDDYAIRYEDGANVFLPEDLPSPVGKSVAFQNKKIPLISTSTNESIQKIFIEARLVVNGKTVVAKENNVRKVQVKNSSESWEKVSLEEMIDN